MHRYRFNAVFALVLLVLFTTKAAFAAALPPPPAITAEAAILVEASSGRVIYEKNADRLMYPASMTKMVTCLLALEQWKDLSAPVTISPTAAETEGTELTEGETTTMRELLMALMMDSDNGAAVAVAEAMTPTKDVMEFAANMTQKAWLVGAKQTQPIADGVKEAGGEAKLHVAEQFNEAMQYVYALQTEKKKIVLLENDLPDNY